MKILNLFFLACALALTGIQAADDAPKADNTETNKRDKDGKNKTPGDQSNKPEDLKLTQNIRKAVMSDKSLTMTAKNVKIITADGQVTLRGPVTTDAEKAAIEKHAKSAAGETKVISQLEVKK